MAARDAAVETLARRELGCQLPAPGGPRQADGFVAIGAGAVIASDVIVRLFPEDVAPIPAAAASGGWPSLPAVTESRRAQPRPAHLVYSARGGAVTCHAATTPSKADQLSKGELEEFDDVAVDSWMRGKFDLGAELARMSGAG